MQIQLGSEANEGGLHFDSSSNPKAFDFTTSGMTWKGIYSLDGDTLTLCYEYSNSNDLAKVAKRPKRIGVDAEGLRCWRS